MGSRDAAKGESARKSLGELAARVRVEQLAADDPASIAACAARLAKDPGRIDALINNAAIYDKADAPASKLPIAVLQRTFATNLHGPLQVTQELLPLLRRSERGRVINLSSGMGQLSGMGSGSAAYRLSKTALNGLTATLAAELAPEHIAVNCVCPGWVKTDMGGAGATREVAQGADTPVWLALDAPQDLTGKFFRDRTEIPW
jgi:NAD(P)-dependent dehydrogenase (short-subunit alcohol dehydrogenase family)